ncbi:MAG TPA: hypothetical protein VMP68_06625 [Candidatus Eisenbacteria bacterium]|nr:hypothetical protein [Candidatus Eisenbacteria bacterium]
MKVYYSARRTWGTKLAFGILKTYSTYQTAAPKARAHKKIMTRVLPHGNNFFIAGYENCKARGRQASREERVLRASGMITRGSKA